MDQIALTHSEMACLNECPRRHELCYERLLRPRVENIRLSVGSAGHAALAVFYGNLDVPSAHSEICDREAVYDPCDPADDIPSSASKTFGDLFLRTMHAFDNAIHEDVRACAGHGCSASDIEDRLTKAHGTRAALRNYLTSVGPRDLEKIVTHSIEQTFHLRALNPVTRRPIPMAWIDGRIDITGSSDDLGLFVMDHKFMDSFDEVTNTMALDMQLTMYAYAVARETGKFPNHVVHNIIRKPRHKRKEKKSSKSSKIVAEPLQSYEERIYSLIRDGGEWTARIPATRNAEHFRILEYEIMSAIQRKRSKQYRWRNVGMHCNWKCSYKDICIFENPIIEKRMFRTADTAHEELL